MPKVTPMKVWILFQDDGHEGAHLVGVYSTQEYAERVKAERRDGDDYIEERALDERVSWRRESRFEVRVSHQTGHVTCRHTWESWRAPSEELPVFPNSIARVTNVFVPSSGAVSRESFEHAEQLALQVREEWLKGKEPGRGQG